MPKPKFFKETKTDDYPWDNPLIRALDANDVETLTSLLEEGKKPDLRHAFTGPGRNNTDPKILDLLAKYGAMPEGVSLSTLKFTLFAMGNSRISASDFWDKPDLNLNGCPQKLSPIVYFTKSGNVEYVTTLIQRGVTERPINYLFKGMVDLSVFRVMGWDELYDVYNFKERISNRLAGWDGYSLTRLEYQCEVAVLLLSNPTDELDQIFTEEKESLYHGMRFLPLFAWAAKNNRADLLDVFHFKKLFQEDKSSAKEAVVVAAAFSSIEFLTKAIQENLLDANDIEEACIMAAANADNKLLASLIEHLSTSKENKESGVYYIKNFNRPLFLAVHNGHHNTAEFLLKAGASPSECDDDLTCISYLQLATDSGNTDLMELLLFHGANIDYQDSLGCTALHHAAKRNNLEALKILITAGANIDLANEKGQKPLNCIKDEVVRGKIQEFVKHIEADTHGASRNQLKMY